MMDFLLIMFVVVNGIGSALFFAAGGVCLQRQDWKAAKASFVMAVAFASFGIFLASTRLQWIA